MAGLNVCLLLFSHPDPVAAEALVRTLVTEKEIACGHVFPLGVSIYEWEGNPVRDEEVNVLLKLPEHACQRVADRVRLAHPYAVPEILFWPIKGGNSDYLEWVMSSVLRRGGNPP
ncbi:MAG: divalent-cation tolerance protein CutA [Leptospirales bacterium]